MRLYSKELPAGHEAVGAFIDPGFVVQAEPLHELSTTLAAGAVDEASPDGHEHKGLPTHVPGAVVTGVLTKLTIVASLLQLQRVSMVWAGPS